MAKENQKVVDFQVSEQLRAEILVGSINHISCGKSNDGSKSRLLNGKVLPTDKVWLEITANGKVTALNVKSETVLTKALEAGISTRRIEGSNFVGSVIRYKAGEVCIEKDEKTGELVLGKARTDFNKIGGKYRIAVSQELLNAESYANVKVSMENASALV